MGRASKDVKMTHWRRRRSEWVGCSSTLRLQNGPSEMILVHLSFRERFWDIILCSMPTGLPPYHPFQKTRIYTISFGNFAYRNPGEQLLYLLHSRYCQINEIMPDYTVTAYLNASYERNWTHARGYMAIYGSYSRTGIAAMSDSANRLTARCSVLPLNHSADHAIHHQLAERCFADYSISSSVSEQNFSCQYCRSSVWWSSVIYRSNSSLKLSRPRSGSFIRIHHD